MSIWRRLLKKPDPPIQIPPLGEMYRFDDDNTLHVFEISTADFNIYEEDGLHWLTVYVLAEEKIRPNDGMNPEPHIEINLPFDENPLSRIFDGAILKVTGYHQELSHLASMYYWTHSVFVGRLHIERFDGEILTARIEGVSDNDPVAAHADFRPNAERTRSFE